MARTPWVAIAWAVLLSPAACCPGERHRRLSAAEFVEAANLPLGSMRDSRWIGSAGDRAYLSVWSLGSVEGARIDVLSCALADLPAPIAAKAKAGENPWPKLP